MILKCFFELLAMFSQTLLVDLCIAGAGHYIQDSALCPNIRSPRVEFRRFIGENVAVFVPCAPVSTREMHY